MAVTVCRRCTGCEGMEHHWMLECPAGGESLMVCKHCDATTEYFEDDDEDADEDDYDQYDFDDDDDDDDDIEDDDPDDDPIGRIH